MGTIDRKMKMGALGLTVGVAVFMSLSVAHALPFNQDMAYEPNLPAGTIMRPAPEGSYPLGAHERYVGSREDAAQLQNPVNADADSLRRGTRLWAVNCAPCHGTYNEEKDRSVTYRKAYSVEQRLGNYAPDIASPLYAGRTEGQIFATIHFGLRGMPRYGFKLSLADHWDLVNYVKAVQAKSAAAK